MTELERWMNDHPPLADALTAEETAALRQKVLARRPKPRVLRGRRQRCVWWPRARWCWGFSTL